MLIRWLQERWNLRHPFSASTYEVALQSRQTDGRIDLISLLKKMIFLRETLQMCKYPAVWFEWHDEHQLKNNSDLVTTSWQKVRWQLFVLSHVVAGWPSLYIMWTFVDTLFSYIDGLPACVCPVRDVTLSWWRRLVWTWTKFALCKYVIYC